MLEVTALRKSYGDIVAVDGVSLNAGKGETIGLLGPNGAGKTTTVSMIAGLVRPDSGTVLIDGRPLQGDTDPAKRAIGLVPQDIGLFDEISARENLHLFGALYGMDRANRRRAIDAALDLVGLAERAKDKVAGFSGGMMRRLNLAAALLHDPQLLLLDEPTVGVDPQSRNAIFDNLETLKKRGKTLLYTTHYMEEAERLCDRVAIMDHGRVLALGTPQQLIASIGGEHIVEFAIAASDSRSSLPDIPQLTAIPGVQSHRSDAGLHQLSVRELHTAVPRIFAELNRQGLHLSEFRTHSATLEDVFVGLTGRNLRDE